MRPLDSISFSLGIKSKLHKTREEERKIREKKKGIITRPKKMVKERRREELCVSVPTLFRCPISMDLMKSPVSLCTGVTYDRSSIETWLALGHNTCPATMQTLPSTHTTPNLTLRRLIHLWLLSQSDTAQKSPLELEVTKQQAADIIKGEFNADSMAKLVSFMANSEENLKFVAQSRDCVSKLVETLSKSDEIRICEMIVRILNSTLQGNGVKERLNELILKTGDDGGCLSSFVLILQKGTVEAKVKSAEILELIAVNLESRLKIAEKPGLLYELYNLSNAEADASAVEAGLSALLAISTSRPAKKELIRFGIVKTVGKILSGGGAHDSLAVRAVIEKGLAILELVATCTEGRGAICDDVECVVGIVKNLMKCSSAATEHGITVLWSVCCLARDSMAQEMVTQVNGLTKVLLVMQSDCSLNTRKMCGELVKILRAKNSKSNLAPYETRTTHITPY